MRYNITRKINLKRFFPDMSYESVDFTVLEADSKEEANKELAIWVDQWIKDKTKEVNDKRTKEEKFDDSLNGEAPKKTLTYKEDQEQNGLPKKEK